MSKSLIFLILTKSKSIRSLTFKVIRFNVVEVIPIAAVLDVVEVPRGGEDGFVALLSRLRQIVLPLGLGLTVVVFPHLKDRVTKHLAKSNQPPNSN